MQFEWNARTQITMWFDNTEDEASLLRDYGIFTPHCLSLVFIFHLNLYSSKFLGINDKIVSGLSNENSLFTKIREDCLR